MWIIVPVPFPFFCSWGPFHSKRLGGWLIVWNDGEGKEHFSISTMLLDLVLLDWTNERWSHWDPDIADICNSDGLKIQPTAVNQFLFVSRELWICDNMIHEMLIAYVLAWQYMIIGDMDSTIDPSKELSDGEEPCCATVREQNLHICPDQLTDTSFSMFPREGNT